MSQTELGLKTNWKQFTLLVIVNALVGGMIGLERAILQPMAEQEFEVKGASAVLSFIVVFGIVKALSNYYAGALANKLGRKKLLIIGWLFAIPVPFILIYAQNWNWVVAANVLLGINQGLAWSSTVVMKIDIVGDKHRGLAMGLNEFAGYLAVALVAILTATIADQYGIRPYPFYLGIAFTVLGLLMSIFLIKDTVHHVKAEASDSSVPRLKSIFKDVTWKDHNLGSITQAGLINNLNDGMVWGILPILLIAKGFDLDEAGIIVGTYPAVWGMGQLITGKMADHFNKKYMLVIGMLLQAIALFGIIYASDFWSYILLAALLGWGTAMVYPTFMATIADLTHPDDRAKGIGIFRLWRDLGYAVGAILTGALADLWNYDTAMYAIGGLTLLSTLILMVRMRLPSKLD